MQPWKLAIATFALAAATPASACYTGPFWLTFAHGSSAFADGTIGFIGFTATLQREDPKGYVRITFYNPGAGPAKLWQSRIAAVRALLRREGVPANMIEVVPVRTSNGMVGTQWIGRAPKLEIDFTRGCG